MQYIVYVTINWETKNYYIGVHQTEDPYHFDGYLGCGCYANHTIENPYTNFQKALKNYGTNNFYRFVLGIFDSANDAYEIEKRLVNNKTLQIEGLYNMIEGGNDLAAETTKVSKYDVDGNLLQTYNSVSIAAAAHHVTSTAILNAIKFKYSSADCYWAYGEDPTIDMSIYSISNKIKKVYQYDLDGNLVCEYNGTKEISLKYNISNTTVTRSIKGGYKIVDKYYLSLTKYDKYTPKEHNSYKGKIVYLYNLDGSFAMEFKNCTECWKYFKDANGSNFGLCAKIDRPYHGYKIRWEKFNSIEPHEQYNKWQPVDQYDLDGNFIKHYESIQKAINDWGQGVKHVLLGHQTSTKGYIFKYSSK